MGGKDDGVKVFSAAKYGSVKVFIVVQERRASRSPSWRRSAAKDGKVTLTLGVYRGAGAKRFRASEARRGLQLGDGREALNDSARAKRGEVCSSVMGARARAKRGKVARRGLQLGDVRSSLRRAAAGEGAEAMCSSARVGVGEGAEAFSSTNFGRPGALLGSSVAFGSGCG